MAVEGVHRQPIRGLAQRIESQQPPGVLEDAAVVVAVGGICRQPPDAVDRRGAKPVALATQKCWATGGVAGARPACVCKPAL